MRVGVAQIEPRLGDRERNLEVCLARLEEAAAAGCSLLVLPECAIPGYMFESPEEAAPCAEEIPGPATEALAAACARLGLHCVCGLLERSSEALHNTAALVGPQGIVGRYRKTHLPFLGVDRFVVPGDDLDVFDTPVGRIGIQICYDLRFPEPMRALALRGAELVAVPTNWPVAARVAPELFTLVRAAENRVFLASANRVGRERWAEFCGWSQIVDPAGRRLAEAGGSEETLLVADVDLELSRTKDIVSDPGIYELHLFGDRRPDLYASLSEEANVVRTT